MRKAVVIIGLAFGISLNVSGQLKPGDQAVGFNLLNVDSTTVSLNDYSKSKGIILIFTCNPCPFAKAYEDRIIWLHKSFASAGYPVIAINPNDETMSPDDSFEAMKVRAKEKSFPFVYLKDDGQVFKAYGATRTPQVFMLKNEGAGKFTVAYIGSIDNNAINKDAVSATYVFDAIVALEKGKKPVPAEAKAIGCTIKSER